MVKGLAKEPLDQPVNTYPLVGVAETVIEVPVSTVPPEVLTTPPIEEVTVRVYISGSF